MEPGPRLKLPVLVMVQLVPVKFTVNELPFKVPLFATVLLLPLKLITDEALVVIVPALVKVALLFPVTVAPTIAMDVPELNVRLEAAYKLTALLSVTMPEPVNVKEVGSKSEKAPTFKLLATVNVLPPVLIVTPPIKPIALFMVIDLALALPVNDMV